MIIRNLMEAQRKTEEAAALRSQNTDWIPYLRLKDGEFAEFRFITSVEDAVQIRQHSIQVQTAKGLQWRKRYCTYADIKKCAYCDQGNKPSNAMFFWVWVDAIYHKSQNNKLDSDPSAQKWNEVKISGEKFFKQTVNGPHILSLPPGKEGALRTIIIEYNKENGGLSDRNYKVSRKGGGLQTTYTITPKNPTPLVDEILQASTSLPDLGEVAIGKVYSFTQKDKPSEDSQPEEDN